jgi:hypothetical protein
MARVVLHRGSVRDVNDPVGQGRIIVEVPALGPNTRLGWAKVYMVSAGGPRAALPEVGDEVLVTFELGNLTLPVIFPPAASPLVPGLMVLPGVTVDRDDPLGQKRVRVRVPALSEEYMSWGPVRTP